jgi:DNA-binding transcriptional ArsR family regulator
MPDRKIDINSVFHALGDPTRRAMVERLTDGVLTVSRLAAPFDITLTAVVQHLQVLEQCGLVRTEKPGRVRTCQLDPAAFSALETWIKARHSAWERRLDRLGDFLSEPGNE